MEQDSGNQSLPGDFVGQFGHPDGLRGRLVGQVMSVINRRPNRRAIAALEVERTDDVLELGFGTGRALRALSQRAPCGFITGVDQSATMLAQAETHNRRAIADGRMRLIQGSFEQLPMKSASVDKVLAVNVIYFISPKGNALSEARRVLRAGGTMAVYATDYSKMRRLQFAGPETFQMFDRESFAAFFKNSVFCNDAISVESFSLPFGFRGLVARIVKGKRG